MINHSQIWQCPGCKSTRSFSGTGTNVLVCPLCNMVLYKTAEGSIAEFSTGVIQQYKGSIQPGTTGVWGGRTFQVMGGCRVWFEESVFNYWTIEYTGGEMAWLAEGYGLYYIMNPIPVPGKPINNIVERSTGQFQDLGDTLSFLLEKKQKSLLCEFTGESWFPVRASSFTVSDLAAVSQKRISIFDWGNNQQNYFDVFPAERNSLELKNLNGNSLTGKTFSCKQCKEQITVKTYPYSQSCSCRNCRTYHYTANITDFKSKEKAITSESPDIIPGSTGILKGTHYEVVGYVQKEENNSYYSKWREYVLFNQQEGFAYLSEYDGHWILLKEKAETPVLTHAQADSFIMNNREYVVYNAYKYKVINAVGEFPYNLFDNDKTKCREYIAPPYIWIEERDKKEGVRWFAGEYIRPSLISDAFTNVSLPLRVGVGAVQPGTVSVGKLVLSAIIGLLLLLFTHFMTTSNNENRILLDQSFMFPDTVNTVILKTEKYTFHKKRSNILIQISADVKDSWFELEATLVNADNGKEYTLQKGVEYYSGYSDGEHWSEGSKSGNAYFTRVPKGNYYLQLQGTREANQLQYSKLENFSLEISYDVTSERNLWISLILLMIWPVGKYFHIRFIESERWRNSPFSNSNDND